MLLRTSRSDFFCIRCDGRKFTLKSPFLLDVVSPKCIENSEIALEKIINIVRNNIDLVFRFRAISKSVLRRKVEKINSIINSSLIKVYEYGDKYNYDIPFNDNVKKILLVDEYFRMHPKDMYFYIYSGYTGEFLFSALKISIAISNKIKK